MRHLIVVVLLSIAIAQTLPADYLYTQKNRCIIDYWINQDDQRFYYIYSHDPDKIRSTSSTRHDIISGYDYNASTEICAPRQILRDLQITNEQYHFLIGLTGLLTGFIFLFFGVYLAVEVAKK